MSRSCWITLLVLVGLPLLLVGWLLWVTRLIPPDYREDEPVQAAGTVTLLYRGTEDFDADSGAVASVLEQQGAAPVPRLDQGEQEPGGPQHLDDLRPGASTPALPPLSDKGTRYGSKDGIEFRLRLGPTAMRICASIAPSEVPEDPVVLCVNHRQGGQIRHFERILVEKAWVDRIEATPYNGGKGVLILISGRYGVFQHGAEDWASTFIYRAEAPEWRPQAVLKPAVTLARVGQTVDGARVYCTEDYTAPGSLLEIDNARKTVRRTALRGERPALQLIISPQGNLGLSHCPGRRRSALQIVDLKTGATYRLTARRRGDYEDREVAWSASVANRVYLRDVFGSLYALDFDLSRSFPVPE